MIATLAQTICHITGSSSIKEPLTAEIGLGGRQGGREEGREAGRKRERKRKKKNRKKSKKKKDIMKK